MRLVLPAVVLGLLGVCANTGGSDAASAADDLAALDAMWEDEVAEQQVISCLLHTLEGREGASWDLSDCTSGLRACEHTPHGVLTHPSWCV
jgi:hypothetical protein